MLSQLDEHTKILFTGNILLILCCVFYLIWWSVAFRPEYKAPMLLAAVLFIITAISGISGLVMIMSGIRSIPKTKELIPILFVIIGGIVLYIVLFFLTSHFLKRQITTELFLIIGWGMLAFSEVNVFYGSGKYSITESVIILIVIIIAVLVSMICYIAYYQMPPFVGYIDGMIPLLLIGIVMTGITLKLVL